MENQNGKEETTELREIGAVLARRRQEKGLSLRDVENATKIRARYLEGLEQEDYSSLPDPVYVRGFLKTYANFLGLDGESLSREFRELRGPRRERHWNNYESAAPSSEREEPPPITPGGLGGAERRRISAATLLTLALAVLILAAVGGTLYLVGSQSASETSEEPAANKQAQPSEDQGDPSGSEPPVGEATTPETLRATVRIVGNAATGMTIQTDGTVAYDQVAQPGFSREFEAQEVLSVSAANGGAVEVQVEGRDPERLAAPDQPATREFTIEEPEG